MHPPAAIPLGPAPGVEWPRNCVPSVHLACALVMALAAPRRTSSSRLAWAYAAATCVSTLVDGGHYLVDLIVAVPFAVAVWLAVHRRWAVCAVAAVAWALWVVALRGHMVSTAPASIVWGASALTIALSAASARDDLEGRRP